MPKSMKAINDEIVNSLKVLDDLSQNSVTIDPKKKTINSKELKSLTKISNTLNNDIEFFKQAKEIGIEAEQKIKTNEINNKEKEKIINFISNCYEDEARVKDSTGLDNEKLLKTLESFIRDVDGYIQQLNKKLKDVDVRISSEKDALDMIRKDMLKEELEEEDKALENIDINANKFDQELEKLELLEDELNLALMDRDNKDQIDNVRELLNKRMQG